MNGPNGTPPEVTNWRTFASSGSFSRTAGSATGHLTRRPYRHTRKLAVRGSPAPPSENLRTGRQFEHLQRRWSDRRVQTVNHDTYRSVRAVGDRAPAKAAGRTKHSCAGHAGIVSEPTKCRHCWPSMSATQIRQERARTVGGPDALPVQWRFATDRRLPEPPGSEVALAITMTLAVHELRLPGGGQNGGMRVRSPSERTSEAEYSAKLGSVRPPPPPPPKTVHPPTAAAEP